jgi:DNA recombination protein RmuC
VGSLESRVLVSARRLNQLGVVDAELEAPQLVETTTRALSAPELVAESLSDGPELVSTPLPWRAAEG